MRQKYYFYSTLCINFYNFFERTGRLRQAYRKKMAAETEKDNQTMVYQPHDKILKEPHRYKQESRFSPQT
ncbi:hypothetical protein HMPREF1981_01928 [Bacteroides pyogenes F0041]|uniref:Uncharacterized protein n=1 Tax=Bacteroides pyogenes F0041 TaxID=1321819 RepID=U2DZ84_9BACE|nr:hypothetical protein HMPREF1981_01928 [Bacteroides pyogenes F0041]